MRSIAKIELPPVPMYLERSHGSERVGTHASTMELYLADDSNERGIIEWDIPTLERTQHIGVWFERLTDGTYALEDYDGVFSLPPEAVKFLRDHKYIVTEEFE